MNKCIICKTEKPSSFGSCDKCGVGLCDKCKNEFRTKLNELTKEKIKQCSACKTKFYDFCSFCQNQTINEMIYDKLYGQEQTNKNILLNLIKFDEKKWNDLTHEQKNIIGCEPDEYLQTNWNYCDCDNHLHCYDIANIELKKELGITNFTLYERGLDYLLCTDCWYKEFEDKIGTRVI